jgi:hypothetical protein
MPLYILNRRLDEPHTSTGVFKEVEDPLFLPGIEAGFLEHLARNTDPVVPGSVYLYTELLTHKSVNNSSL